MCGKSRPRKSLRDRLKKLGLKSFPMITGGKGVHVVVPLARGHSWDHHRDFAEAIARIMAEEEPDRFVATMSKAKRKGKIFVDYLRNTRGARRRSRRTPYVRGKARRSPRRSPGHALAKLERRPSVRGRATSRGAIPGATIST